MCRVSIVGVSGKASVDRRGQTNKALRNQLISPSWVFLNSGVNPTVFVYGTETLCKPLHRPSSSSTHLSKDWYLQSHRSHKEGTRFSRRPLLRSIQVPKKKKKGRFVFPITCQCPVFLFYFLAYCYEKKLTSCLSVVKYFWALDFVAMYCIYFPFFLPINGLYM